MIDVTVEHEQEAGPGWLFRMRIATGDGPPATRRLTLAWADYNLWSGDGADPPHAVAAAVLCFVLGRMPLDEVPDPLDAAWARRRFRDADGVIPGMIGES